MVCGLFLYNKAREIREYFPIFNSLKNARMKTHLPLSPAILLVSLALLFSCTKKDADPPMISILGDNPYILEIGEEFLDPGATATDGEDGDLTANISIENNINNALKGNYEVKYIVSDQAGNRAEATRYIFVVNNIDYLGGSWEAKDDKLNPPNPPIHTEYTETITPSDSVNKRFWVTSFGGYVNATVYIDRVTGSQCQIPQQEVSCGDPPVNRRFMGTATIIDSTHLVMNYTEIGGSQNVTGSTTYTKAGK
jgi:hypothetical protein